VVSDAEVPVSAKQVVRTVKVGDEWHVVRDGASRPVSTTGTKALAKSRGIALARRTHAVHVVHHADGKVWRFHRYGTATVA
jgi:hypothetical protein